MSHSDKKSDLFFLENKYSLLGKAEETSHSVGGVDMIRLI